MDNTGEAILRALDFDPDPPQCETFVIQRQDHCAQPALYLAKYSCPHCAHVDQSVLCQTHRDRVALTSAGTTLVCQSCHRQSLVHWLSIMPIGGCS